MQLNQQGLMNLMARAYELQETLAEERERVRIHDKEYQELMVQIAVSKVQKIGKYEVKDTEVQKQRKIISDKFRERWPDLFNQLATVTMKAARERIKESDLEEVCELKTVTKPKIIICQTLGK
jgi:ATP-dependent DNA helicase RecQ